MRSVMNWVPCLSFACSAVSLRQSRGRDWPRVLGCEHRASTTGPVQHRVNAPRCSLANTASWPSPLSCASYRSLFASSAAICPIRTRFRLNSASVTSYDDCPPSEKDLLITDLRHRLAEAEEALRAIHAVIDSANEAVLVCDRNGIITHANAASSIIYEGNRIGQAFAEIIPLDFHGTSGVLQADDVIAMVIAGVPIRGIEASALNAPKKDYLVSAAPLRVSGGRISGAVVTMVDLSHRKAAEERQQLLMRELDHRVKNTLAMVVSISARTASKSDTVEAFQKVFSGRIQALAATHNLLLKNSWSSMELRDIVKSELAPYVDDAACNMAINGLNIALVPRAAIAFGLIVHELTTNAVKYGSLSQEGGRVTLRALGDNKRKSAPFVLEWRESGGPRVAPPERKGFGYTVITRSLQYGSGGGAEFDFDPAGLVCRVSVPSEDLS